MATLNEAFSTLSMRRRYEVWFVRVGLANQSGAWWFRYLLMNPGRDGCGIQSGGYPVQVWAIWFPANNKPRSFIQGFSLETLDLSGRGRSPFLFRVGENGIDEHSCWGALKVDGHAISWNLRFQSTFRVTLSNKGWIGFSRTPHSDALFSGQIARDDDIFSGEPLGYGVQGHNCGYRHRNFWRWAHAYFHGTSGQASTLEALVYEMPFGLIFRKAVLWHHGVQHLFRDVRETNDASKIMHWKFHCVARNGLRMEVNIDGRGPSVHHLHYMKTDCKGTFEVINNSLASATLRLETPGKSIEMLETSTGAVLEIV